MAPRQAKPLEKRTKADLLETLGRKLTKDELVTLNKAVAGGYRPYSLANESGRPAMSGTNEFAFRQSS
jgi:hypothetical protein